MRFFPAAIIILLFILYGCNEQNRCYESTDTLMIASFTASDFSVYDTLIVNGVSRTGKGDTLVYDTLSSQSKRYPLPLSLTEDSTGFVIQTHYATDTIYLYHTMTMKFISEYCGYAPEYQIEGASFTSGIDSVQISDPIVNTKSLAKKINDQNITIYFHFSAP